LRMCRDGRKEECNEGGESRSQLGHLLSPFSNC
jgi:hypothetical protein